MAHELNFFTDGRARMAYVGDTPWHGKGQKLTPGASLDVWAREAGMDFEILGSPVAFKANDGKTYGFGKKQVLYRADNQEPLWVAGCNYKVVQPMEVLEFFRNLVDDFGFQLETAGVLFSGQKYWALARVGDEAKIKGKDAIRNYVMLATSCDGTLRTVAKQTDVRVVCNNTLTLVTAEGKPSEIRISHSSQFKAEEVQQELVLMGDTWKQHVEDARALADRKLTDAEALAFTIEILGDPEKDLAGQPNKEDISKVLQLYKGQGLGAELKSSVDTAWGIVNSFSEMSDWHKGKDQQRRLENSWFFAGDKLKSSVFKKAVDRFVHGIPA